jgi:chloramphenicol O-acetyltransferase type B
MMMFGYYFSKIIELLNAPVIKKSILDKTVWIGSGTQVVESSIQYGSYLGNNVQCLYTDIGKFCSIANNCIMGGAEHPLSYVSTSPVFYGGYRKPLGTKTVKCGDLTWESYRRRISIGNDVWIGNNVIIKAGVTVGTGAVIGAGAVVVKDVPPYEIWGGNPAKLIRPRFSDELRQRLIGSSWWDLQVEEIKQISMYMNEPEKFLSELQRLYQSR